MLSVSWKTKPIQTKRRPLAQSMRDQMLNPKQGHSTECDLKKQSQFAGSPNEPNFNINKEL
jgi:hypothetical protein